MAPIAQVLKHTRTLVAQLNAQLDELERELRRRRPAPQPGVGRPVRYPDNWIIRPLVENPKRPGSRAHEVFKLYSDGITVAQFCRAAIRLGLDRKTARAHLSWDVKHDFIKVLAA
jgi:hypothetical protein